MSRTPPFLAPVRRFLAPALCVGFAALMMNLAPGRAEAVQPPAQGSASASSESRPTGAEGSPETADPSAQVGPSPARPSQSGPAAGGDAAGAGSAAIPRSEYPPEAQQLVKQFEAMRDTLAEAMADLRAVQIRYANNIDRSPSAEQAYRERRNQSRQLLNETYDTALGVIRWAPDKPAATYLLTLIQNREANDIYNASTFEGAARLLDLGLNYVYLFRAAARSAVVSGEFETARKIYDTLAEEELEDVDRRLKFQMDQLESQWESEQKQREKDAAEQLPRVRLRTTRGDAVLELYLHQAPSAASHFIRLVEDGFYDGLSFYQVVDHVLALAGDPAGDRRGNAGQFLVDEHERSDARAALRGSLVMAKLPAGPAGKFVPNSASSQFAILFLPMPQTAKSQTIFGRVIEGMDVISSLRRVDPAKEKEQGEVVAPPDRILEAEVIRRPETLPEPVYVGQPGQPPGQLSQPPGQLSQPPGRGAQAPGAGGLRPSP